MSCHRVVQITDSTKISGSEMKASSHGTPKKVCVTQAPSTLKSGMPTTKSTAELDVLQDVDALVFCPRCKMPLKISGRPSRLTSEPTTIIVTPHHSDTG